MDSDQIVLNKSPAMKVAVAKAKDARYVAGRRAFFKYRELGVTDATGGRMRAQVTLAEAGLTEPTGWHYHTCEMQYVYMLKGWVELEFADGRVVKMEAGDSALIPGGMPHQETRTSDSLQLIEVSLPAEMGTVACEKPAKGAWPRGARAMQLCIGTEATSRIIPGRRAELKYRDFGVAEATHGRMRAQVFSGERGMAQPTGWHHHVCDMQIVYVLNGWFELELADIGLVRFNEGDCVHIPGGWVHQEVRNSDGFNLLEISVPAAMGTIDRDKPASAG